MPASSVPEPLAGLSPPVGVLNVNKPCSMTSRDVVDVVQRLSGTRRCGHAGTLDPLATGVLLVAVGSATRLVEYLQRLPKTYRARFQLGVTSDTEDAEGVTVPIPDARRPSVEEIQGAIPQFIGDILQTPPQFSALKVNGRRAYALARRGQLVELTARPIHVDALDLLDYQYPWLDLRIRCGAGTYIRSLGRDLAVACGTGAVMTELTREAIGSFTASDAITLPRLETDGIAKHLHPLASAVEALPQWTLSVDQLRELGHGRFIDIALETSGEVAAIAPDGELAAIIQRREDGRWGAAKFLGSRPEPLNP
ncbi:MAG: tRNA pseudouridine(55) synthase TruB [Pirellulales bacterium]